MADDEYTPHTGDDDLLDEIAAAYHAIDEAMPEHGVDMDEFKDAVDTALAALTKAQELRVAELRAAVAADWQYVEEFLPANGRTVLAVYETIGHDGKTRRRIVKAAFFKAGTLEIDTDDESQTDEEGKNREDGWYEDSEEHDPCYMPLGNGVMCWQPLPPLPEGSIAEDGLAQAPGSSGITASIEPNGERAGGSK